MVTIARITFILFHYLSPLLCKGFTLDSPTVISLQIYDTDSKPKTKKLDGKVPISSRRVPIGAEQIKDITIWELEKPSELVEKWWSASVDSAGQDVGKKKMKDPFGVIMWPGSILASRELARHQAQVADSTVLVLGAGTGVEAQCAALLGASKVIALDVSGLTLKLLQYGAEKAGVGGIVQPTMFDLFSGEPLPECDILVAADVLYNSELAEQIGRRVIEVLERDVPPCLVVTDSQRFHGTDFLPDVNNCFPDRLPLEWQYFELKNVKGSGVMIDGDQMYDALTRMVSVGWK